MANKVFVDIVFRKDKKSSLVKETEKEAGKSGRKAGQQFGKNFNKNVRAQVKGVDSLFSKMRKNIVGLAAGFIAFRSVISILKNTFTSLREVSRGIAEVNSILPANKKLTEQSIATFSKFAKTYGSSSQQQAKAFYTIVSAGVKGTAKQLETLRVANESAIAGLVDINTASRSLVSSVNAYAASGLTAQQASDSLFVAVREGQTTFGELADFLGNTSAIASSAGVSFDELTGTVAALTKGGIETSKATIALRSILSSIIKPSDEAKQTAKDLGIEFSTSAIKAKGFAGFLSDVAKKSGGNTEALGKLFGNVRGLSGILKIVNSDFGDFKRILDLTAKSTGAQAKATEEIKKSFDFKITKLNAEFKEFALNIGKFFVPGIITFVTGLNQISKALQPKKKETSIDLLRKSLKPITKEINGIITALSNKDKLERDMIVSGNKNLKTNYQKRLKVLRAQRQTKLALIRAEGQKETEIVKTTELTKAQIIAKANKDAAMARDAALVGSFLKAKQLNLLSLQDVRETLATKLGVLVDGNEAEKQLIEQKKIDEFAKQEELLLAEQSFQERKTQLIAASAAQEKAIMEAIEAARLEASISSTESMIGVWDGLSVSFDNTAATMKKTALGTASIFKNAMAKGISGGIQNIVGSLMKGENAFANFGKFVLQTFGALAIQLGEFWIAQGIAVTAGKAVKGMDAVIAGAALVAVGSIMQGMGGGGGGGGSAPTGGVGDPIATSTETLSPEIEEPTIQQQGPRVALTIEGNVFDTDDTRKSIVSFLNESFDEDGTSLNNASFA